MHRSVYAVLGLAACAADAPDVASHDVARDTLVIERTIGGMDDDRPEFEFGRIHGLAATPAGGVVVADPLNNVLRVFDAGGAHRFSIGREGAGPGELRRPCCPAFDEHGDLWVRDGGNARYNVYRMVADSASYLRQVRMAHGDRNRVVPTTFDAAGNLIDIGSRSDTTGQPRTFRFTLDSAGAVLHEVRVHAVPADSTGVRRVQREVAGGVSTQWAYQPHGPGELIAHGPRGEFAHAVSGRYAIDWRAADGGLIRHVTGALTEGPPLSAAERAAAEKEMEESASWMNISVGQLGFGVPDRKPPLRNLFFDQTGRLWVELSVADGAPRTAHVYAPDGSLERAVVWPREVRLDEGALTRDVVWGSARDSLDVPSIVRLRPR